ncbi:hypothetical protein PAECIP111893_02411 [Paenibacillus plantiphilus]|uniref:Uncharacterized protein n=1 Tax=Paenibacillus plantiphilus TaxID=2905650 RepID=A0ABN8GHV2_9BACL|nr:hypothetical protein PAECIP111893_02411 [Paenibacillus plantiphilus]
MRFNSFWEKNSLMIGIKYVKGNFAHTFYLHLGCLVWVVFVERGAR